MNLSSTLVIFRKELKDILRDRRTLLSMVIIPMLLVPVLMLVMGGVMESRIGKLQQQKSRIAWVSSIGAEDVKRRLAAAEGVSLIEMPGDTSQAIRLLREKELEAVVSVPVDFDTRVAAITKGDTLSAPSLIVTSDQTRDRDKIAVERVQAAASGFKDELITGVLREKGLGWNLMRPFVVSQINIVSEETMKKAQAAMMLPYLVILMVFSGAMYPAVDMTAGEKERGTLETLLVSGVSRVDIVLGKFLTVLTTGMVTAGISITSMALSFKFGGAISPLMAREFNFALSPVASILVAVTMLPLAMIFAGLLMTIALFAKSYREAQSYVTPLTFVVIFPAMSSMMPGSEPTQNTALIPVMNVSVLLKQAMIGQVDYASLGIACLVNFALGAAALFVLLKMFRREKVLFRV